MRPRHQAAVNVNTAHPEALVERPFFREAAKRRQPPVSPAPGIDFIHISYRAVFIALFCLLGSIPARAAGEYRTAEVESLRIAMDTAWCSRTAPGYWPVRFDITNLGGDRVIELHGQGSRWWTVGEVSTFEINQSIRLKRSDHVKLTIPVPIAADTENLYFQIRERGRILHAFGNEGLQSGKRQNESGVLIVADPATPLGAIAYGLPRTDPAYSGGGTGFGGPNRDLVLDPLRLPSNWLGLTSVRAVFIGPKEWEKLAGPQKEALLAWTASGGDLMFVDGDLPALLPDQQTLPISLTLGEGNPAPYYFGSINLLKSEELRKIGLDAALLQSSALAKNDDRALPVNRASGWSTLSKLGFSLPIPGIGGVPVRSYLIILIVFSVLIGPVNFVWLWRKRRQVLLVLTAPLISAAFILLLSGYVFWGEGFGITGRAESFTLLDQKTNHAATRATVSMYAAGMAPGNGLQFSRGVAVIPISLARRGSRERQVLDLTDLQQFSAGIAKARAPANFEEVSFRPARERLSFNYTNNGITVVNALGATISRLIYRDDGKVFMLDVPLKAGEKASLRAADGSSMSVLPPKFRFLQEIQAEHSYIAWLERSPFLEMGAPNVKERDSLHIVLGYVGEKQ
jgi:hypothetical protein